jgi:hypothetical protein
VVVILQQQPNIFILSKLG